MNTLTSQNIIDRSERKLSTYDFITIDFEIANNNFNSACSLGMVFVNENEIVDEKYFLIKPPNMHIDEKFSKIHGLTEEDLIDAPTFKEVWKEIKHFFNEDTLMIAHNAHFDMSVLKNCIKHYSIKLPRFNYICSIPISTIPCSGEGIGNSLKDRTKRFGICLDNHHNALSDARATAELVIKCIKIQQRKSIYTYCINYLSSINIKSFVELKNLNYFKNGKKFNKVNINEIEPSTNDFDEKHCFFGKQIVFTGNLENIERKMAMQKVVDFGGILKNGVSRNTDYLIVGIQDKSIVGDEGISSKERKAIELMEKGYNIEILKEEEFLNKL